MKFLPFENYILTTRLSVDEVTRRLSENIEPKKMFRFVGFKRNSTTPYEGELTGNSFTINRIINYRNSFRPIISGHISNTYRGTEIKIKMQPHIMVIVFMSIWLGGFALVGFVFLIVGLAEIEQVQFPPVTLLPLGMLIVGYAIVNIGFRLESSNSKKFLTDLFEAQEETESKIR